MGCVLTVACGDKGAGVGGGDGADGSDGSDGTDGADGTGDGSNRVDADHDGSFSDEDCDDNDYRIYPGADEICDGVDNDCDDAVDEGFDGDADGHVSAALCDDGDDCDDADPTVNPSAAEVPYNGVDEDCDGDDLLDAEGDGFDSNEHGGNDCDDAEPAAYPGAVEVAKDGIDQDCDGADLLDADGDGFDDESEGGEDCDDADAAVFPGAWEWDNDTIDHNCDGRDGRRVDVGDLPVAWTGAASGNGLFGSTLLDCDVDGDGLRDLVVGAPFLTGGSTYSGAVGIYLGAQATGWPATGTMADADVLINGASTYEFFGFGGFCVDVDGDGADELFLGAGEFGGGSAPWTLRRFDGSASWSASMDTSEASASFTYDMNASGSSTVYSISMGTWDVDDDGTIDRVMVAPSTAETSGDAPVSTEVWLLDPTALETSGELEPLVDTVVTLAGEDQLVGYAVAPDLDGDGFTELVVSQSGEQLDSEGATTIYPGSVHFLSGLPAADGALSDLAFASLVGASDGYYGYQTAFGDFDGDGTTDAMISRLGEDRGGAATAGAVYFHSDIATDLSGLGIDGASLADAWVLGEWNNGRLGLRLGTLGDLDGDGADDVLVAEPSGGVNGYGRTRILSGALFNLTAGDGTYVDDVQLLELASGSADHLLGLTWVVGDFDGDGTPDPVIGARAYSTAGVTPTGAVYPLRSEWWTGR